MTGTSLDGVDAVLAQFSPNKPPKVWSHYHLGLPQALRSELLALNENTHNELTRAAQAGIQLADVYANACQHLLHKHQLSAQDITAIGAHGQTVRHHPQEGFSIQINAPAHLAERCKIDVIADFRARDLAAGGQGAPLAPAFHQELFATPMQTRAVLNLGGIANVSVLKADEGLKGFDTGPANILLDLWCQRHTGKAFDQQGRWAASGRIHRALLETMLAEPWFSLAPPKSTGRDLFNAHWLEKQLKTINAEAVSAADVQATLQALTVFSVAEAIQRHAPETQEIIVCGGGAYNTGLLNQLQKQTQLPVRPSDALGVPAQLVEALGFAWLAKAHVTGQALNLETVTGAKGARILGCCYPA